MYILSKDFHPSKRSQTTCGESYYREGVQLRAVRKIVQMERRSAETHKRRAFGRSSLQVRQSITLFK